jgi:hypothetical protein
MALVLTPNAEAFLLPASAPQVVQIAGGIAPFTAVSNNTAIATVSSVTNVAATGTWNPSDKNVGVTLSGGNLIATRNATGAPNNACVRATVAKSSGKWYWEITLTSLGTVGMTVGVMTSASALNNFIGSDSTGWAWQVKAATKYHSGSGVAYGSTCTTGDIIGVALDLDGGTLSYYKNGTLVGTAFTGVSGALFPAQAVYAATDAVTANFSGPFAFTPPGGFSPIGTPSSGSFTVFPVASGYASITVTDSTP